MPISPVSVHKLDGLSEDVFAFWVAIKVIHKAGHRVVEVISLDAILIVHDKLDKLKALALVHSQHYIIVEELT